MFKIFNLFCPTWVNGKGHFVKSEWEPREGNSVKVNKTKILEAKNEGVINCIQIQFILSYKIYFYIENIDEFYVFVSPYIMKPVYDI